RRIVQRRESPVWSDRRPVRDRCLRRLEAGQARHRRRRLEKSCAQGVRQMTATSVPVTAPRQQRPAVIVPVGLLLLVLLPLLLMPLASVFVFAFNGGLTAFLAALGDGDAQF